MDRFQSTHGGRFGLDIMAKTNLYTDSLPVTADLATSQRAEDPRDFDWPPPECVQSAIRELDDKRGSSAKPSLDRTSSGERTAQPAANHRPRRVRSGRAWAVPAAVMVLALIAVLE